MKICFLHTDFRVYWLPRLSGLYHFLKAKGHDLCVVEIAGKGSPYAFSSKRGEIPDWQVLFPEKGMEDISSGTARHAILAKLNELNPDIVFAGAIAYPSGATAVKWGRDHHIPVIIFDDARFQDVPRGRLNTFVKKEIYRNIDGMLIPAPSHVPDYQIWGIPQEKMYFGLNVVDNHYWESLCPPKEKYDEYRAKYHLPPHFYLGVGRQVPKKNWRTLLEAFCEIDTPRDLVLVGNGPERHNIEDYSIKYGHCKIHFYDFLPSEELSIFYALSDALILPSLHGETWGLTVNEAMACGTPVLVSNHCGCCTTLCTDGETGFSYTPDRSGIAGAIQRFESLSAADLLKMKENVRQRISEWDLDRFEDSVLSAAVKLTSTKGKPYASLLSRIIINLWKGRYRPV